MTSDLGEDWERGYYHITNVQFSTETLISDARELVERVRYEAYGKARHGWPEDLDGGGSFGAADRAIGDDHVAGSTIGDSGTAPNANYNVLMDFDYSGTIEQDEYDRCQSVTGIGALDPGAISNPDFDSGPWSCAGYDGYIYDDIADLSCVRFRWYDAALGRWMTRDPLEHAEGPHQYQAFRLSPPQFDDPMGLCTTPCPLYERLNSIRHQHAQMGAQASLEWNIPLSFMQFSIALIIDKDLTEDDCLLVQVTGNGSVGLRRFLVGAGRIAGPDVEAWLMRNIPPSVDRLASAQVWAGVTAEICPDCCINVCRLPFGGTLTLGEGRRSSSQLDDSVQPLLNRHPPLLHGGVGLYIDFSGTYNMCDGSLRVTFEGGLTASAGIHVRSPRWLASLINFSYNASWSLNGAAYYHGLPILFDNPCPRLAI